MSHLYHFFFLSRTPTSVIYPLSLHDALPIYSYRACRSAAWVRRRRSSPRCATRSAEAPRARGTRSEEHTSELQSRQYLVCRLLLEKKKEVKIAYGLTQCYRDYGQRLHPGESR